MLRFIKVEGFYGDFVRINADQIVAYRSTGEKSTKIFLTNGKTADTVYSPEEIDEMLEHINAIEKNNVECIIQKLKES